MANAHKDDNRVSTLLATSNADQLTPVDVWADPTSHALLISGTISVDTTGLATSSKQDTIIGHLDGVEGLLTTIDADTGTIATDSADSLTALQLITNTVTEQGTALGTTKTILNGASVTTAAPTYTTGQISPLNMATTGALRIDIGATSANATAIKVNVASGGIASGAIASGALASGSIAAGAITAGNTSIATTEDTARAAGEHVVKIGASRLDTPVANANVSTDGDYTNVIVDNFGKVWVSGAIPEDTAHISGEAVTAQGSRRIGTLATSSGSDADWSTVNQTAEGAAWATLAPTTTSGLSVANFTSGDTFTALTATAQVIKSTAGLFYGYYIYNPNSSATYVEVFDVAAASVTVGTTAPLLVFCIPASSGANLALPYGLTFGTAMSIAATTTGGGNTAPTTALEAMVFYK